MRIETVLAERTDTTWPAPARTDVDGPNRPTGRPPRSVLQLQHSAGNHAVTRLLSPAPVQRVRIKLRDEDPILMGRLRLVPSPRAGAQAIDHPDQIDTLEPIGKDEDIIFEGHGNSAGTGLLGFGPVAVVAQGGHDAAALAGFAHRVPKPADWTGSILLHGCSTGALTEAVSRAYFKLTKTPVTVKGTLDNVKVGTAQDGSAFLGSDWTAQPAAERPADLAYVAAIEKAFADFKEARNGTIRLVKQGGAFRGSAGEHLLRGTAAAGHAVPDLRETTVVDLAALEQKAARLVQVDGDPGYRIAAERDYARPQRDELYALFAAVAAAVRACGFWTSDAFVALAGFAPGDQRGRVQACTAFADLAKRYTAVVEAMTKLSDDGNRIAADLSFRLLGLTLKPIDMHDPTQARHHRMERTKTSILGDTWVDRAAPPGGHH